MAPRQNAQFFLGYGHPAIPGGLPLFGKSGSAFFVDPANGADGNAGTDIRRPLASLGQAHSLMTAGQNDICYLIGDGSTAATNRITDTLTWSKNACHLIGVAAPSAISNRSRISHASTAPTTVFTPMVQVTASGCVFANVQVFEGFNPSGSTACVTWEDQGGRNYYWRMHFAGMSGTGSNPTGDNASSANLLLTGGGEHYFEQCTIGTDTIARSAANAGVRFRSQTARNQFRDCLFLLSASAASPLFGDANAANALNRASYFWNCIFSAADNISPGGTAIDVAFTAHANANGTLCLHNCAANNVSAWAAASTLVRVSMGVPSVAEAGIMLDSAD